MHPAAQAILDQVKHAHDPTPADRARVRAKLSSMIRPGSGEAGDLPSSVS